MIKIANKNVNRRNFIKSITLGIGVATLTPTVVFSSNEVPLYEQFDWIPTPTAFLFRINDYGNEYKELVWVPVIVKTYKLKLRSGLNVDYTQDQFKKGNKIIYTNDLLLNEAKNIGLTHLYCFDRIGFVDPISYEPFVGYCVRGVTMTEWKTVNGKPRIVKVNKEKGLI